MVAILPAGLPPAVSVNGSLMLYNGATGGYAGGGRSLAIGAGGGVSYTDSSGTVRTGAFSNGIFYIAGNKAGVMETDAYAKSGIKPDFATQSGPLMVINGAMHPKISPDGTSAKLRNGVCVNDTDKIDFVLLDANHRYIPTLEYYRQLTRRLRATSIVVIDDIHRSEEMEKAWKEIKSDTLVYGSVDLYRCGLLFFDPSLNKQHFIWSLK